MLQYGSKQANHAMLRFHLIAALLIGAGVLAMGADNIQQLERCTESGRNRAECELIVLGR